jgi:hypothetical protein
MLPPSSVFKMDEEWSVELGYKRLLFFEDEGSMFFRNAIKNLQYYTGSDPRRQKYLTCVVLRVETHDTLTNWLSKS